MMEEQVRRMVTKIIAGAISGTGVAAIIISDKSREIANELTNTYRTGITLLNGQGGYHGTDRTILYSVISRKNICLLQRVALEKDPDAFIALMAAENVPGVEVGNQPHCQA